MHNPIKTTEKYLKKIPEKFRTLYFVDVKVRVRPEQGPLAPAEHQLNKVGQSGGV